MSLDFETPGTNQSVRRWLRLNRVFFYGVLGLVVSIAVTGSGFEVIALLSLVYVVGAVVVFLPERPWWGQDVRYFAKDRQSVVREFRRDAIAVAVITIAASLIAFVVGYASG